MYQMPCITFGVHGSCFAWFEFLLWGFFLDSECVSCDVDEQLDEGDEDEFKPLFDYSDTVPVAPEFLSSGTVSPYTHNSG